MKDIPSAYELLAIERKRIASMEMKLTKIENKLHRMSTSDEVCVDTCIELLREKQILVHKLQCAKQTHQDSAVTEYSLPINMINNL